MRLEEIAVSGPIVSITSPGNNALVVLPTNLVINAAVSGFNSTVTNVAFYNGSTKLADDPASPYSFAWSTVTPGLICSARLVRITAASRPVGPRANHRPEQCRAIHRHQQPGQ